MKRILSLIFALSCAAALLAGCGADRSVSIEAIVFEISGDRITAVAIGANNREAMGDDYFFVDCGKAEIKNSGGEIGMEDLEAGDLVEIVWDGTIVLSYPQQIKADTVTVTSEEQRRYFQDYDIILSPRFNGDGYPETSDLDAGPYEISILKPLEITCDFLESDSATAELTMIAYKDNCITGDIEITFNMPDEFSIDQAPTDELFQYLRETYVFTWHYGDINRNFVSSSNGLKRSWGEGDIPEVSIYTKHFTENIEVQKEDVPVEIIITGFENSLSFTIPGEK